MKTSKDSLQINANEDGTFSIEWDRNDPRWQWMNDLTDEQLSTIIKENSLPNETISSDSLNPLSCWGVS